MEITIDFNEKMSRLCGMLISLNITEPLQVIPKR